MSVQEEIINPEEMYRQSEKGHRRGKICGGILVILAGSIFLAKELGAEIPHWILSWKTFLIALGLVIGAKHNFRHTGWIVLIIVGVAFLLVDFYEASHIKPLLWPILIILLGLFIIFKPRRKLNAQRCKNNSRFNKFNQSDDCYTEESSSEDFIESTTFMGSVKKNVLSKKFKGGEVTNFFGGAEINLSQADFEKTATMEMTNIFGGVKLIVPANWEISSESVSVFGSIEDKRPIQSSSNINEQKILVLKGTNFFGGIEIKSY